MNFKDEIINDAKDYLSFLIDRGYNIRIFDMVGGGLRLCMRNYESTNKVEILKEDIIQFSELVNNKYSNFGHDGLYLIISIVQDKRTYNIKIKNKEDILDLSKFYDCQCEAIHFLFTTT